jgi:exopolysaccharide biosynthesis polyprenyl glycosylphosphotransferase
VASKEAEAVALSSLSRGSRPHQFRDLSASVPRDSLFRRLLLVADLAALALSLWFTIDIALRLSITWACLAGFPAIVLTAKLVGLYDRDEALIRKTTLDEAPKLFQLATLCTLVVWLADWPVMDGPLHRSGALLLWIQLTTLLIGLRTVARAVALRLAPVERCLFIGDVASERRVQAKLVEGSGTNTEIVAHIDLQEAEHWSTALASPERLDEIRALIEGLGVNRVIIAPGSTEREDMLDLVCALKALGMRISVLPRLLEVMGSSVEFDDLHGIMVMGVHRFALTRSTAMVKRSFDLAGAVLCLLLTAPLFALIALAIKLDSRGPVFFRQLRVGRHGTRFQIVKFRTMIRGAETMREALAERNEAAEGLFKIGDDPRITRVGRLLRKTCLDELPQLINILRGEMSLVGPRPLVVEEDMRLQGRHRQRLELLPGITGHWQILGPARVPLLEMAVIDYLYIGNWSLWSDIKILLRTVPHVIARRGL